MVHALFKRRRSHKFGKKRKSYKHKTYKRKTHMRKKRRFPTGPRIKTTLTSFPKHTADRVRMKMKAEAHVTWYALTTGTVVDPDVGYNCAVAIPCNQISTATSGIAWSPITTGYTTGTLAGYSSPNPLGWAELFKYYTACQIRGCRMRFELTQCEYASSPVQFFPIQGCVVPMTNTQYTSLNTPASSPYNQIMTQPKARKFEVFRSADAISAGLSGTTRFSMYDNPAKIFSVPGYYNNASSWHGVASAPTDLAYYVVYLSGYAPLPTNQYFTMKINLEWSVEFFLRAPTPFSVPLPIVPLPEPSDEDDEKAMDLLPTFPTLSLESKEEKKEEKKESKEEKKSTSWFS